MGHAATVCPPFLQRGWGSPASRTPRPRLDFNPRLSCRTFQPREKTVERDTHIIPPVWEGPAGLLLNDAQTPPPDTDKLDFTQNPGKVMDDITFVRSYWWLVSEGFSLSTANSRLCTKFGVVAKLAHSRLLLNSRTFPMSGAGTRK